MRFARTIAASATAAVLITSLAACGGSADESGDPTTDSAAGFPVTVDHTFGQTVIESKPERVATVAWANQEVPLALGIVPVGMAAVTWGDDDGDGVLPWVEEKLAELNAPTPVLFDETDGIDFEAVAATEPDVILAAYSGLTQEEYDTLSQIAPVIAEPGLAWGTSMEDMIRLNSKALGLEAEGLALIADLDQQVDTAFANYPELAGKSVLWTWIDPTDFSTIGFYTTHDSRPGFLLEVGMTVPALVTERSAASDTFWETISAEQADLLSDVDIIVTYDEVGGPTVARAQADPLLGQLPALANGAVVVLQDNTPLAASANPSPLSIGWGIDDYFALLAEAASKSA